MNRAAGRASEAGIEIGVAASSSSAMVTSSPVVGAAGLTRRSAACCELLCCRESGARCAISTSEPDSSSLPSEALSGT